MIIIGCDLHTRFQQIAMLDTETGEVVEKRLEHENGEARRFYEGLETPALVGIESTGYTLVVCRDVERARARVGGGGRGEDSGFGDAQAEARPA